MSRNGDQRKAGLTSVTARNDHQEGISSSVARVYFYLRCQDIEQIACTSTVYRWFRDDSFEGRETSIPSNGTLNYAMQFSGNPPMCCIPFSLLSH